MKKPCKTKLLLDEMRKKKEQADREKRNQYLIEHADRLIALCMRGRK